MSCTCPHNLSFTLSSATNGSTWQGFQTTFTSDGTTFDDDVASVAFTVLDSDGASVLALTDGSGITINDAATWDITVDAITPLTVAAGVYSYTLQISDAGGIIRDWLAGSWEIRA